jgi:hypothetical protein
MRARSSLGLLCAAGLAWNQAANAEPLPKANKLIVLVQSEGCDLAQLKPRLGASGVALAADRHTSRVIIDWPADAERNLDLMGRPSPVLAAIEVNAKEPKLRTMAARVRRDLGTGCHVGFYLVSERRLLTLPRTWPLGGASPGSKILNLLVRKEGLTLEQFDAEWAGPHAKLALSWREEGDGETGRYAQNLVVGRIGEDGPLLDGIGEGEGPGMANDRQREARMKAAEHSRSFINMQKAAMFNAREVILKD